MLMFCFDICLDYLRSFAFLHRLIGLLGYNKCTMMTDGPRIVLVASQGTEFVKVAQALLQSYRLPRLDTAQRAAL